MPSIHEGLQSKETCPLFFCSLLLLEHFKCNYSGPIDENYSRLFPKEEDLIIINELCLTNYLSIDGEFLSNYNVNSPYFLTIAANIIQDCEYILADSYSAEIKLVYFILKLRTYFFHQKLLFSTSHSLKNNLLTTCKLILDLIKSVSLNNIVVILILFEILSVYLYFRIEHSSREILELISSYSGLTLSWTGISGRRLIHQQQDYALLSVVISKGNHEVESILSQYRVTNEHVPEIVTFSMSGDNDKYLEADDQRLETDTKFTQLQTSKDLSNLEIFIKNSFILAQFEFLRVSTPSSVLRTEQLSTLINYIISSSLVDIEYKSKINWTLFSTALALRSIWVESNSRKAVRSCLQLETLISQIKNPLKEGERISDRLTLVWSIPGFLSYTELQKSYGILLDKLGAHLSAYDVYCRLGDMSSAIKSLVSSGKHERAINALNTLLEKDLPVSERLSLLCLMGDLKGGIISFYQEAWELSNHKYAIAQRLIGFSLQNKGNFSDAIVAFNLSLKINPHFLSVWFSLGCCYIKTEEYDSALSAFRRSLGMVDNVEHDGDGSIEVSSSEIWSNIALVHSLQGYIQEAFNAIREAVKGKYDDYRLWDNYLTFAIKLGKEPSQVLLAISRLNEIRPGSTDWKLFDSIWNSFQPTTSEDVRKEIMRYLEWMSCIEPAYGSEVTYWIRRAMMTSKLSALFSNDSSINLEISEWDCWMRAYQTISSISYSINSEVEVLISLLENMSKCVTNINERPFSSILNTVSARIKKSILSTDDMEATSFLKRIEGLNRKK